MFGGFPSHKSQPNPALDGDKKPDAVAEETPAAEPEAKEGKPKKGKD